MVISCPSKTEVASRKGTRVLAEILLEDLNILSDFIVPLQFLEEVMSTITKKNLSYLEAEPIRASEVNLSEDNIEKMKEDDEVVPKNDLVAEVTE